MIIDVAPGDSRTWSREEEKIDKCMGTQEEKESTNKGGISCDWSFGNHYHKTEGLFSRPGDSYII